jgi:hypothetical protein
MISRMKKAQRVKVQDKSYKNDIYQYVERTHSTYSYHETRS